ncbi:hypothetical protein NBRC116588_12870 [Pyruvatibacter sp. HU-CL02332]
MPLKGILGGKPYPVFHIDALYDDELLKIEDAIRDEKEISPNKVSEFCNAFIEENDAFITHPFVVGCSTLSFSNHRMPDFYEAELTRRSNDWHQTRIKLETETQSLSDKPGPVTEELDVPKSELESFAQNVLGKQDRSKKPSSKKARSSRSAPKTKRKSKAKTQNKSGNKSK